MSLLFNGINQYCQFQNENMALTNGAIGIWYHYQAGPNDLNYLLSTGGLSSSTVNIWYSSGGNNAGTISLHRGSTFGNKLTMPNDFKSGSTPFLIIWELSASNNYLWFCKAGGNAVRQYCGSASGLAGDANWNLMRRGDGNANRYASGVLNQFFKITTTAVTPLTEQQVENLANELDQPQNLNNADIVFLFDEGAGTTATDVIRNEVMTLHGSPLWQGGAPAQVPQGQVTFGSIFTTSSTAEVNFSYSLTDQTGFEYRLNGGSPYATSSPVGLSGLAANTSYNIEVRAINAMGTGVWSAETSFSTDPTASGASFSSAPLRDNTGQLLANQVLEYVALYDPVSGSLVTRVTNLSTDSNGIFTLVSDELSANNQYRADWKLANGASRMPLGTAL